MIPEPHLIELGFHGIFPATGKRKAVCPMCRHRDDEGRVSLVIWPQPDCVIWQCKYDLCGWSGLGEVKMQAA